MKLNCRNAGFVVNFKTAGRMDRGRESGGTALCSWKEGARREALAYFFSLAHFPFFFLQLFMEKLTFLTPFDLKMLPSRMVSSLAVSRSVNSRPPSFLSSPRIATAPEVVLTVNTLVSSPFSTSIFRTFEFILRSTSDMASWASRPAETLISLPRI